MAEPASQSAADQAAVTDGQPGLEQFDEAERPCCDFRDHGGESPLCSCPFHERTGLHPFGGNGQS